MSSGVQAEVREALAEPRAAVDSALGEFRPPDLRRSVREAVTSTLSPPNPPTGGPPAREASEPAPAPVSPDTSQALDAPDDPSLN